MATVLRALLRRCLAAALRWLDEPAATAGELEWEVLADASTSQPADEEEAGAGRRVARGTPALRRGDEPAGRRPAGSGAPATEPRGTARPRRGAGGPVSHEGHAYVVWRLPGAAEDLRGVHAGGLRGWAAITAAIPGGRYRPGADRLRRAETLSAAIALYEEEAERHEAPAPTRVFVW